MSTQQLKIQENPLQEKERVALRDVMHQIGLIALPLGLRVADNDQHPALQYK